MKSYWQARWHQDAQGSELKMCKDSAGIYWAGWLVVWHLGLHIYMLICTICTFTPIGTDYYQCHPRMVI